MSSWVDNVKEIGLREKKKKNHISHVIVEMIKNIVDGNGNWYQRWVNHSGSCA